MATRPDPIPNIRAAGFQPKGSDDSAAHGFRSSEGPGTPEAIKKYRKSFQNDVGTRAVHHGVFGDHENVNNLNKAYGRVTTGSEGLGSVIKAQTLVGMADKFNNIKEMKYASNMREPLGQVYSRHYNWPETVKVDQHSFGLEGKPSEPAKDLLYPQGGSMNE